MDITTLFGILSGIGVIFLAIFFEKGNFSNFLDLSSVMIVLGGTMSATLIHSPIRTVLGVAKATFKILFRTERWDPFEMVQTLMKMVDKRRYHGAFALEDDLKNINDGFFRKGVELAIDESDTDKIRNYLELELENMSRRHAIGHEILTNMGTYAPAFGMLGTVIGLIMMMHGFQGDMAVANSHASISISEQFGQLLSGTAVALTTTFYGIVFANLVCIPLAGKLRTRSEEELFVKEIMIEGIIGIQTGEFPVDVYDKMAAYFPHKQREMLRKSHRQYQKSGGAANAFPKS